MRIKMMIYLEVNLDLIEAIALGNDIGHTPFGHKGEMYYIMTAADAEKEAMDTTLACFRGYANCIEGAKEMGLGI